MFDVSKGAQHINNIWWQNDPYANILRKKHNDMTDEEARSMILWIGMLGGMINSPTYFTKFRQKGQHCSGLSTHPTLNSRPHFHLSI